MERQLYISADEELKRELQERIRKQKKYQVIYTDDIRSADFVLIERQPDGSMKDAQFADLVIAREIGMKVTYIKGAALESALKEKQMKDTRRRLDMEME